MTAHAPAGRRTYPRDGAPAVVNGLTGLAGPFDVAEDPARGTLSASELAAGRLTLFATAGTLTAGRRHGPGAASTLAGSGERTRPDRPPST